MPFANSFYKWTNEKFKFPFNARSINSNDLRIVLILWAICSHVIILDDPPEISFKDVTKTELSCKYRKILQVSWKNLASKRLIYCTDISCKKIEQIKVSCNKLPRILQVLSDRLTRENKLTQRKKLPFVELDIPKTSKNFLGFSFSFRLRFIGNPAIITLKIVHC